MSRAISLHDVFFDVEQVPIEAVARQGTDKRRVPIPSKKALLHGFTGTVLGVVSRDYRVVTNKEAVDMAKKVCERAFPGISPAEWEPKRAAGPRTLSHSFIDLMHRTHVLNYWDSTIRANDPYTPFLRVTNSFNGVRALRFDIGFMRKHCSNGCIFEREVATITAAHNDEALEKLEIEIKTRTLPQMWDEFSKFITSIRGISMSLEQSVRALNTVLRMPPIKPNDKPERCQALEALAVDFGSRLDGYRKELGPNAYSVFHTLTDIAARPPESRYFQKDRNTIENRSGRWLKELGRQSQTAGFDLEKWIPTWEACQPPSQPLPGRN